MTPLCQLTGRRRCILGGGLCSWMDPDDSQWHVMVKGGVAYTFCFWTPSRHLGRPDEDGTL